MDQNEKISNEKVAKLENEIKVLKNEVQAVLLDLRESYLNMENPFNTAQNPAAVQPIVITQPTPANVPPAAERDPKPEPQPRENPQPEPARAEKVTPPATLPLFEPEPALAPEMKPVLSPIPETKSQFIKHSEPSARKNNRLDMATVAGLSRWVEDSTKRLGRERTEAVLDISEVMGYISVDLKPIILKLIALAPPNSDEIHARTRDYIDSLIKLNGLLGQENREETTLLLLSLMSGDQSHG